MNPPAPEIWEPEPLELRIFNLHGSPVTVESSYDLTPAALAIINRVHPRPQ